MTTKFSYNLANDIGRLRLNIGDTINADTEPGSGVRWSGDNFTDAELQAFIDGAGSDLVRATSDTLLVLANEYSSKATTLQFGSFREEMELQATELRRQAATWYNRWREKEKDKPDGSMTANSSGYVLNTVIF